MTLLYTTLALFAWVVTCILAFHPITATSTYEVEFDKPHAYGLAGVPLIHSFYTKNENLLRAAQVVRSIVAVLTIPLASAVCSKAAVTFVQQRGRSNLSLRQMITLADRGWTDPAIYHKLLSGRFKQYATKFLISAMLLNVIGGIIAPLQSFYLTTTSIKTPTFPQMLVGLTDMLDQFDPTFQDGRLDNNLITVLARASMNATSNDSPQGRLWTGGDVNCSSFIEKSKAAPQPPYCGKEGISVGNMSQLPDPYLAQLPSGYSTGLIRQYLLRINSTARRDVVTESEFPMDCDSRPGAFYRHFAATNPNLITMTGWGNWSLTACMPADLTHSPWRAVRSRQDFTEELYLNISLISDGPTHSFRTPEEQGGLFKISIDTTAGYFELPNYMNGERPGPLLDDDPTNHCGGNCTQQASSRLLDKRKRALTSNEAPSLRADTGDISTASKNSLALEQRLNRGPLATTALALFGSGSFIEERMNRSEAFYYPNRTYSGFDPNYGVCVDQAPFMSLLRTNLATEQRGSILEPCLTNAVFDHDDLQRRVTTYVRSLYWNNYDGYDGEHITNAFTSAAFLSNEAWLLSTAGYQSWSISYDLGADTTISAISLTGIIVISAVMGVFLASILALAVYSALEPCWTDQLDAFAMLRIGASIAPDIQFRVTDKLGRIKALDELPGWVGDATDGEGSLGELALGAPGRLNRTRQFPLYVVEGERRDAGFEK